MNLTLLPGENKLSLTINNAAVKYALTISKTLNTSGFYSASQVDALLVTKQNSSTAVNFARGNDAAMTAKAIQLAGTTAPFLFFNTEQNTPYFWNGTAFV